MPNYLRGDAVTLHEWLEGPAAAADRAEGRFGPQLDPRVNVGQAVVFTHRGQRPLRVHAVHWSEGRRWLVLEPSTLLPGATYRCPHRPLILTS